MSTTKTPPVTEALREAARLRPGGWVYALDPVFDPDGEVPPTGIVGAWQVDPNGSLTGDFTPNPSYVPSPIARGWRKARSQLEFALQASAAGLGSIDDVREAYAAATVWIFAGDAPDSVFVSDLGSNARGVFAFSDPSLASQSGADRVREVESAELARRLPTDVIVVLNSGSSVYANITPTDISIGIAES